MYGMSDAIYAEAEYSAEKEKEVLDLRALVSFAKEEIFNKVATSDMSVSERARLISLLNGID